MVDAFQGRERDVMAISLTRSKLLLVGDSSTLGAHPLFKELLAFVEGIVG